MTNFVNIITSTSLVCLGIMVTSCCSDQERIEIFSAYVSAVNRNNVSEALATHTQDAVFIIPGQELIKGTEKLRSLLQWDSVMHSQIEFTDLTVNGDTIIAGSGSERNLWFEGIGLDYIAYVPGTRIVFEGKLIKGIYPATLQSESALEFELRFQEFMEWAMKNVSEDLARLMPDGSFNYNSESAKDWLKLLGKYNS